MGRPISDDRLRRNEGLFRRIKKLADSEERRGLLATAKSGYAAYEQALLAMAKKYALKIRELKD